MMYQMWLIILLFCQAHGSNVIFKNFDLPDCLGSITKHILRNFKFEINDDIITEAESLSYSIVTRSNYMSYSKNLQIIILNEGVNSVNVNFDSYGYDKNFLVVQKDVSHLNLEELLVEGWIRIRAKIGILQLQNNNTTLISSLNLDNTKVCTGYFYEECINCNENITCSGHSLSSTYLRKLCRVKVAWVRENPYVNDVKGHINPGLMVSLLNVYGEKSQVKVAFQKSNRGYNYEFLHNGTFYKLRRDLLQGRYEAAIGLLFMNSTEEVPFSYGPVFFNEKYFMVTKKRERITSYKKLTIVFSADVWKNFFITYVSVTFSYFLLNVIIESHRFGILTAVFDVYRLSLSSGVSILPQSISVRLLFVFYSFFSVNIDSTYLGTLSSIFTNAPYDLIETDIAEMMRQGGAFNINWISERLLKVNFVGIRNFPSYQDLGHMARNESNEDVLKRVAYAQKNITIVLLSALQSHPYETWLIDYIEILTSDLTLFVTFYIRSDFHLRDSLQFWSQEVFEKGFVSKWMNDITEKNRNGFYVIKEKKEAISLKVQHFEEMFYLLFFGYTLAIGALVLEMVYAWIDKRLAITEKIVFIFKLLEPPPMYK